MSLSRTIASWVCVGRGCFECWFRVGGRRRDCEEGGGRTAPVIVPGKSQEGPRWVTTQGEKGCSERQGSKGNLMHVSVGVRWREEESRTIPR